MTVIKENHLVEKRNVLNEIRANNMTLQELRFFSIYLSKINARDISTRIVNFPMKDFQKIMDMGRVNMMQLQSTTDSLLCKIVKIPYEAGGYNSFQLFKQCRVYKDTMDEWFVEIDAHDEALPLMFEFKDRYFTYELWNALRLKSSNQLRMYELLKQYEKIGSRIISLKDLKELLGIKTSDYPRYNNFKVRILDACQESLEMYTDIKFIYEPIRKAGRGREIDGIKFIIFHNENYVDPLSLADFIEIKDAQFNGGDNNEGVEFENDRLSFLAEACDNEFGESEIQILYNLIVQILPHKIGESVHGFQLRAYDHLKHRYDELKWRAERTEIKNRFGYLKKILESDVTIMD